jgi:hypothetical protein
LRFPPYPEQVAPYCASGEEPAATAPVAPGAVRISASGSARWPLQAECFPRLFSVSALSRTFTAAQTDVLTRTKTRIEVYIGDSRMRVETLCLDRRYWERHD